MNLEFEDNSPWKAIAPWEPGTECRRQRLQAVWTSWKIFDVQSATSQGDVENASRHQKKMITDKEPHPNFEGKRKTYKKRYLEEGKDVLFPFLYT